MFAGAGDRRVDVRLQHRRTQPQHVGMVHVASTPSIEPWWFSRLPRLPMYETPSIVLPVTGADTSTDQFWNRGSVRPSGTTADRGSAMADGRVDQRRELDPVLRESLVQVERREQSIRRVRGERVGLEALSSVDRQLIERDVRVVDAVSAPEGLLLVELDRQSPLADPRHPSGRPRTSAARCVPGRTPAKIKAPGMLPAAGFGAVGLKVEYWSGRLSPGRLVIQAQPEGQRQAVVDLELIVHPQTRVGLSERREHRNVLIGVMNLTEQERGKRVAGRDEVVAAGVEPSCPEAIEREVSGGRRRLPSRGWGNRDGGTRTRSSTCGGPLTHVRSFENCQRLFFWKPNFGHPPWPMGVVRDVAAIELDLRRPRSVATRMPPSGARVPSHSRCGQFAPAERWLPPMNQRSQAIVEWFSRLLLDDPVELLVGVVGRDALKEPAAVVVGILGRLLLRIVVVVAPVATLPQLRTDGRRFQ